MPMSTSTTVGIWTAAVVVVILLAVWLFRVPKEKLQSWHNTEHLKQTGIYTKEQVAYGDFTEQNYREFLQLQDFSAYLKIERQYIQEVCSKVQGDSNSRYNTAPHDGNYSFELTPDEITGGVLLVHGLSDSPHHIRAVAEIFKVQGYYVIGLRLPGHGSIPASLVHVDRKDWIAAVEFGAAMVQKKLDTVEGETKFYAGGFSTGGAVTLRYTLNSLHKQESSIGAAFHKPDKLFLFSPAIGVTRLALVTNWHKALSWLPPFKKLVWETVAEVEDDPCKYNSFSKNAGDQIHLLTKENRRLVKTLKKKGKLASMPPVLAFQSMVDATVKTEKLVWLFSQTGHENSELFLFDINRATGIQGYIDPKKQALNQASFGLEQLNFRYTFVTNAAQAGSEVVAYTWGPGSDFTAFENAAQRAVLSDSWPAKVCCLSHVALPISPADSLYGQDSDYAQLGDENEVLGERNVLTKDTKFARLRYNPFFAYVEKMIIREITGSEMLTGKN